MNEQTCPLCLNKALKFTEIKGNVYFSCANCDGIFIDRNKLPDQNSEISRYLQHNNDVNNIGYQSFVSPIVNEILSSFNTTHKGLDFGAGTGPVISEMLKDNNYLIEQYDPFFHNNPELLQHKYDYIVSCEVIEHFHDPNREFQQLKKLLNKKGKLFCMTSVYNINIDFAKWYYKDDPTHVFFYRKQTFEYIRQHFGFSDIEINNNLIILLH